jgi:hypothetical protein
VGDLPDVVGWHGKAALVPINEAIQKLFALVAEANGL